MNTTTIKAACAAMGFAAVGFALSPVATADPGSCTSVGNGTVCQGQESATPPVPSGGLGGQNGPYGPSGNLPPVGN